ncbi:hypothetical protein BMS3Abin07_02621 [bacterium BMS3Abin07]|nr:hypothetical protein BMS3Abin07_02621 [bacterium BMS3Abin07]GBE31707.1 hypothetical protein BMS3Bbin05_00610 [bacterium BMS3Bbin05]HDO21863.1 hypothetical protein [Nitrospirota bacterium]HDZ88251.1 hypothetical protein [Nitrospirota bacterium]
MLVLIKSGPDTSEGKRALEMAEEMSADIVLLQDGTYFVLNGLLEEFPRTKYAMAEDLELRGLAEVKKVSGLKNIQWDELTDMMAKEDKVIGAL